MSKINPIQLQKHLKGMNYPASKDDLLNHVKQGNADENVRSVIERIADKTYENPAEVSSAVSQAQK